MFSGAVTATGAEISDEVEEGLSQTYFSDGYGASSNKSKSENNDAVSNKTENGNPKNPEIRSPSFIGVNVLAGVASSAPPLNIAGPDREAVARFNTRSEEDEAAGLNRPMQATAGTSGSDLFAKIGAGGTGAGSVCLARDSLRHDWGGGVELRRGHRQPIQEPRVR